MDGRRPIEPSAVAVDRRGRILILDDDVRVANVIGRGLRAHHDTTIVYRGAEAVARLEAGDRYDIILCDLMMPEMTGGDVYAAVRGISEDQAARMVFITGGSFMPSASAFLDEVPNLRFDKPIDLASLRHVIRSLLA
jgi:CheY-like chemotaxis protein